MAESVAAFGTIFSLTQAFCQSSSECDEYIRIFKYFNISDTNIYSDIRLYQFFDTNIFGHSFVSKSIVQIYSDIRL